LPFLNIDPKKSEFFENVIDVFMYVNMFSFIRVFTALGLKYKHIISYDVSLKEDFAT